VVPINRTRVTLHGDGEIGWEIFSRSTFSKRMCFLAIYSREPRPAIAYVSPLKIAVSFGVLRNINYI
jgi:hypothetical protein